MTLHSPPLNHTSQGCLYFFREVGSNVSSCEGGWGRGTWPRVEEKVCSSHQVEGAGRGLGPRWDCMTVLKTHLKFTGLTLK